jgi:hypothetical protein
MSGDVNVYKLQGIVETATVHIGMYQRTLTGS